MEKLNYKAIIYSKRCKTQLDDCKKNKHKIKVVGNK